MITTVGRLRVKDILPEGYKHYADAPLTKSKTKELLEEIAVKDPELYVDTLQGLLDIAKDVSTSLGPSSSVSLDDLQPSPYLKSYREQIRKGVSLIEQNPNLTAKQKNKKIIDYIRPKLEQINKVMMEDSSKHNNVFSESIKNGYRGSPVQLTQLLIGDLLVADQNNKPIPVPGLHGYGEGVSPFEYWAGTYATRKGYADVQFATADTGYFGKQLAMLTNRAKVIDAKENGKYDNVGVLKEIDDPHLIGSVLARDTGSLPKGTAIDENNIKLLKNIPKVLVYSALTSQKEHGLSQESIGKLKHGEYPELGAYAGIDFARTVAEPITQGLALSSKHTGSVIKEKDVGGFAEVNQFANTPTNFIGKSILSTTDGKVTDIQKAPQGGHFVFVNGVKHYLRPSRDLSVKIGDAIEKGDMLSDGTPNPKEVAMYKGLGEGKLYFANKFGKILEDNGVPTHQRNLDIIAKELFNKVKITDPKGFMGNPIGSVITYSTLQNNYKPSVNAVEVSPSKALGSYLEKPVLHHTIGTRITKKVINQLKDGNIDKISVSKDAPKFEPYITRMINTTADDPDWKARLAGWYTKKSFLDAAKKGSQSPNTGSTSSVTDILSFMK